MSAMLPALQTIPWAIVLILLPLVAGMLCFLWPRLAPTLGMATASINVLAVAALAWQLHFRFHGSYRHAVGGWGAPLGIDLYADGLSLLYYVTAADADNRLYERREAFEASIVAAEASLDR
ncbi:MAG: hypothetical protein P8Z67_15275, partial [Gammaproteobacteria bacterium]